jgi:D-arabinitol dehydrogenase (NADP+)
VCDVFEFDVTDKFDRIAPFDIYLKEMKIFGVNINPFTFPKSLGLVEAMGDRYLK